MDGLLNDLRFGIRQLISRPGFAAAAILTLALGIGANTAVFSVLNGYLLRPLPYPHGERLVEISARTPKYADYNLGMSLPMYQAVKDRVPALSGVAAYHYQSYSLEAGGRATRVVAQQTTGSLWQVLGVKPLLGRTFDSANNQPGQGNVAVISYRLWQSAFGGDKDIVGKPINLSGGVYRVLGVMPASFAFPDSNTDMWLPQTIAPADLAPVAEMFHMYANVVARLAPGMSQGELKSQLHAVREYIRHVVPADNAGPIQKTFYFVSPSYRSMLLGDAGTTILLLQGAVLLVLLIACINIANLLLSRILGRGHEIAMRGALGATRGALVRQLLVEGLCLAVPGALLGVGLGWLCLHLIANSALSAVGGVFNITIDWRIGLIAFAAACIAVMLASLLPIVHLARVDLQSLLQEGGRQVAGGRGARRTRGALVVGELALATALLAGAGLLLHSFVNLQRVDTGFDKDSLAMAGLLLPSRQQKKDAALASFYRALLPRLQSLPGIRNAAIASTTPFQGSIYSTSFRIRGRTSGKTELVTTYSAVYGDYFKALGVPMLAGRSFNASDTANSRPVVVIGERLARKYFGGQNPIGRQINFDRASDGRWLTIIGVVPPVKIANLGSKNNNYEAYLSALQFPKGAAELVLHTTVPVNALRQPLGRTVAAVNPGVAVFNVETMQQRLGNRLSDKQFAMLLILAFGAIALALAIVGVYGVMSYAVGQRRTECGIRLALGALPADLSWLVLKDGLKLLAVGLGVGLALATGGGFVLSSRLFGIAPYDPLTLLGTVMVLSSITLIACYLPARRAAKLDPAVAMLEQ